MTSPTTGRYLVISADSHAGPNMERDLRPYCPSAYLNAFDEEVAEAQRIRDASPGDEIRGAEALRQQFGDAFVAAVKADQEYAREAQSRTGGDDPHARLRDLNADGIAADVIFPNTVNGQHLPLVSITSIRRDVPTSPELDAAGCRTYNRWLADFCSIEPERHAGLAHVPIFDVAAAVREVEWAREAGLRGVNLPPPHMFVFSYTDPALEPLWSVCEALDMPVCNHAGPAAELDPGLWRISLMSVENPFMSRRGAWQMIFGGVFERHPRLRLVLTEQSAVWLPEVLRDLDDVYLTPINRVIRALLPKPPSEYWKTNVFCAASFMSRAEAALYPTAPNLMWGSDYPHPEGTFPFTRLSLPNTFAGIPSDDVRPMIGETAANVFGFDTSALRKIADRIGPTVADLHDPPDSIPDTDGYTRFAFRQHGIWS